MERPFIEIHKDELKSPGIEIHAIGHLGDIARVAHRDDHYMFIIQQEGLFRWELDFAEVLLAGNSLCYVAPGQVHRYIENNNSRGWFVFIDPSLISQPYQEVFNTYLNAQQTAVIKQNHVVYALPQVLVQVIQTQGAAFQKLLIQSLTDSLSGMVATAIIQTQQANQLVGGQKYKTATQFKQLIHVHYKELKLVKDYASLLHVTPLYLNEVVKEVTGFAASYWIHQQILLEARRLLYYTSLDIKQIAFELGYEDHTYFSRFFKKSLGITASEFRGKNHQMSNDSH